MTENKRFTIFGEWHKDCVIDEIRDNTGEEVTIGRVVNLLNKNEQLNREVKRLSHEQMCNAHLIQQLRNSIYIDPYKEFIKYRNKFIDACEELAEVNKEYGNLKEENDYLTRLVKAYQKSNEQLKQENNALIKLINDLGNEEMDRQMEEILND